ncbi:hypothetical protein COU37_01850 [Candidatus Micrarchaeota archaeon CG10_big_fil_rev_8_21_14_0_10_45_29]|nr:MAG: hypothetical protein COU37_01850 [Candidatus Micrarchaeota archaeon CG10_big_fil_rev_8_21_14_0_10_45_29]
MQGNIPVEPAKLSKLTSLGRHFPFGKTTRKPLADTAPKTCSKYDDFRLILFCIESGLADKDEKKVRRNLSKLQNSGLGYWLKQSAEAVEYVKIFSFIGKLARSKNADAATKGILNAILQQGRIKIN